MAASVKTSGSQTASIGTEHTLATMTDAGVYAPVIDTVNMADGATPDILELRWYGKAGAADTERLIDIATFVGAQSVRLWLGPPLISPHHFRFTLTQTQGTGRAFPWAVYTV